MSIKSVVEQQSVLRTQMMEQLQLDNMVLKQLAEDMIECATDIRGQGYAAFIQARRRFYEFVDEVTDGSRSFLCNV